MVMTNYFEAILLQHLGLPRQFCVYIEVCGKGVAGENDGSVYSCDRYVYPEYRVGNLKTGKLGGKWFFHTNKKIGCTKSESLPKYCLQCTFRADCWGKCAKNQLIRTPDGESGLNY